MNEESTESGAAPDEEPVHVRAFLIADIRGYTSFTRERGDEAAAQLASAFARLTREGVERFGGTLLELRGDEALATFTSTRGALRAAVNLQLGYLRPAGENDTLPLRVGIGLDAGEAVPVEGGFRGSALNMAARLCSAAGPGEILTTETVTHLAGTLADLRYEPRTLTNLKGMDEPVRASLVTSEELQRVMPALPAPVERPPATRVPFLEEMQSADWSGFGSQISSLIQGHLDAVNEEVKRELGVELTALHEESRLPRRHAGAGLPGSLPPSAPIIPAREPGPAPGRPPSRSWLVPALVIAAVIIVVIVLLLVLR